MLWFPIPDDDEMLAAAVPLQAFLKESGLTFRLTGRGWSVREPSGDSRCLVEVKIEDAGAGKKAFDEWITLTYLYGLRWWDR